jgi:hypothetical protein
MSAMSLHSLMLITFVITVLVNCLVIFELIGL